jgi:hypothetical protein
MIAARERIAPLRAIGLAASAKLNWSQGGPISRNSLAKLDTLARRHSQQICGAPNDIALKFVHAPINVNDFPHHLNDSAAAFIVENMTELTSEMVEINRTPVDCSSVIDQLSGGEIVEPEARFQNGVKLSPPGLRHCSVDGRYTDKQRCGCEQAILVPNSIL